MMRLGVLIEKLQRITFCANEHGPYIDRLLGSVGGI